jgi:hypothetical protein
MRTFYTTIEDEQADSTLSDYGEVIAKARHLAFKQIYMQVKDRLQIMWETWNKLTFQVSYIIEIIA